MAELSERIQRGHPLPEEDNEDGNRRCEKRIATARDRQQSLTDRYEALRRKVARATAGGRDLSNKEKAWIEEIADLATTFEVDSEMKRDVPDPQSDNTINARYDTVSHNRPN